MHRAIVFALSMALVGMAHAQAVPHSGGTPAASKTPAGNSVARGNHGPQIPAQGATANTLTTTDSNGQSNCVQGTAPQNSGNMICFERPTRTRQR